MGGYMYMVVGYINVCVSNGLIGRELWGGGLNCRIRTKQKRKLTGILCKIVDQSEQSYSLSFSVYICYTTSSPFVSLTRSSVFSPTDKKKKKKRENRTLFISTYN